MITQNYSSVRSGGPEMARGEVLFFLYYISANSCVQVVLISDTYKGTVVEAV